MVDSGLIVVVSIIFSMIVCVLVVLTYVKYEWCEVLFSNFTVSQEEVKFVTCYICLICIKMKRTEESAESALALTHYRPY